MEQATYKKTNVGLWIFLGLVSCAIILSIASYVTIKGTSINIGKGASSSSSMPSLFGDKKDGDIAILNIEGVIMNDDDIMEALDEIEESKNFRGLIVNINSPGGGVAPSEAIYNRILKIRDKMKVYASLETIAASGGYYIASACPKIYTHKGTLTGSIGVIMQFLNTKDLYAWAKVKPITMKAGKFKDIGSPFRDMKTEESQILQKILDEMHAQFKSDILNGRGKDLMTSEILEEYADGRIFSGTQAIQLGFADKTGNLDTAVEDMGKELKIKGKPTTAEFPRKKESLALFFNSKTWINSILDRVMGKSAGNRLQIQSGVPYFLSEHWLENNGS